MKATFVIIVAAILVLISSYVRADLVIPALNPQLDVQAPPELEPLKAVASISGQRRPALEEPTFLTLDARPVFQVSYQALAGAAEAELHALDPAAWRKGLLHVPTLMIACDFRGLEFFHMPPDFLREMRLRHQQKAMEVPSPTCCCWRAAAWCWPATW